MERDLFRIDLDNLMFNDIKQFTGILRPETERPKENVRIDYKESVPDDLGDTITAFANTYGGLIILGVKSDKAKQNIPVNIPGIKGNPDIKSTIVNKILSTIHPRPSFSIGVAIHDEKKDHVVVVIRVEESQITPHMYVAGHKNKISIRIEDNNKYASLGQIEALIEKRKLASKDLVAEQLSGLYIRWIDDGKEFRSGNYHKIALIPLINLNIRLDRTLEQKFSKFVRTTFYKDKSIDVDLRHSRYYQIEARNMDEDYHRIWRLYSFGAIEFISQVGKGTPRNENLGDMIIDMIATVEVYKTFLNKFDYFGRSIFQHEISIMRSTQLLPKMPPPHYIGDYDSMSGILLERDTVDSKNTGSNQHMVTRYLDFPDIEAPEEIIAESFLEQLRTIFQGSITFEILLENISELQEIMQDNKPRN